MAGDAAARLAQRQAGQAVLLALHRVHAPEHRSSQVGNRRLMGTNPIAFGWHRAGERPLVFDFATSAVVRGEIELMGRAANELPPGWAIDAAGEPTLELAQALAAASLPFGGHKGPALSMMVEQVARDR